jgi:long-chain acyl-CoA synthetase
MAEPTTMCEAFQASAARDPDAVALRTPGDAVSLTWREYATRVRAIAGGLAGLGVQRGETVALMLTNRPEFHVFDTAALHAGATPFSIYNTSSTEQIGYLFGNADNRVVICEEQYVPRLLAARDGTRVEHIVCVDAQPEGTMSVADLEAAADPGFDFEASWRAVRPDDVLTLIYTSGTTGPPKGVEITHAGILAEFAGTDEILTPTPADRVISYLPSAHIADRWGCHYAQLLRGIQLTSLNDPRQVLGALTDTRPTVFGGVPAVWYKLKAGIEASVAAEPKQARRRLATWALETGRRATVLSAAGRPVPAPLRLRHRLADRLVLSKIRHRLGLDQVRIAVSGAAPISPDALEFVLGLGITVCEVWGMSELTCAATSNRPGAIRVGTVGTPVRGVEVRLAEDGELLVRGPIVMRGYRKAPEQTAEAIDADGWLHTGDVATIDADGYVTIVDRKKELIINAAGKNMSPANIENTVKVSCPLLGHVAAIGDNRPYVVALMTLDPEVAASFVRRHSAARHGATDADPAALAANPDVHAAVEAGVKAANERLSRVEQVRRYAILPVFWEPGGEEITPTVKLKRKPIAAKYAAEIEQLYVRT